jgi:hypothetical protein
MSEEPERMRSLWTFCAVAAVFVVTAGCGSMPPAPGDELGTASVLPSVTTTLPPTTSPTSAGQEATVTGTVTTGVEAGCLLLDTDTAQYLLIGGDRTVLHPGRKVVVQGVPDRDTMSTCQQGIPFKVSEARLAG